MDAEVVAAMTRWPNVPDVFGWLSLSTSGQWRLHPCESESAGEPITNLQIAGFIGRNYACDTRGRWYFQNGPQRVFVTLDAAPYILHTSGPALSLETHTGLACTAREFWLDDDGKLYARTEHGPGLIAGRDLYGLLDQLRTPNGVTVTTMLERNSGRRDPIAMCRSDKSVIFLRYCATKDIPELLGFVPRPTAVE